MKPSKVYKLEQLAENSKNDDEAKQAMRILRVCVNHTYHWCPDWDDMVICNRHHAWKACTCDIKLKGMIR